MTQGEVDAEFNRLSLEILRVKLRTAEHEEAKAATERRMAELYEVKYIERLSKPSKKGPRK